MTGIKQWAFVIAKHVKAKKRKQFLFAEPLEFQVILESNKLFRTDNEKFSNFE